MKKRFLAMTMAAVLGLSLVGVVPAAQELRQRAKRTAGRLQAEGSGEAADSEGKSPIR